MLEQLAIKALKIIARKLVDKATSTNQRDLGEWRGKYKLTAVERVNGTQVYLFETDKEDPLRLFTHGLEYRVHGMFYTDLGSVPKIAQKIPKLHLSPSDFTRSYLLHDALYFKASCEVRDPAKAQEWATIGATRKDADLLLFVGLSADSKEDGTPASWADCRAIFEAVRVGAGRPWAHHRAREKAAGAKVQQVVAQ